MMKIDRIYDLEVKSKERESVDQHRPLRDPSTLKIRPNKRERERASNNQFYFIIFFPFKWCADKEKHFALKLQMLINIMLV